MIIITESPEEVQEKLIFLKFNMEGKGHRVSMGKTKTLISGQGLDVLESEVRKYPPALCLSGFNTKSIFCNLCSIRVQKRCGGISGTYSDARSHFVLDWGALRWQTNEGDVYSGNGEIQSGIILLIAWCLSKSAVCEIASITSLDGVRMWQIQWASAHRHLQPIPHNLQGESS